MSDEIITREQWEKTYTKAHPDLPKDTITRMVNNQIDENYGSQEAYEKRLQAQQEQKDNEIGPAIDEETYREIKEQFEEPEEIINPDALDKLERLRLDFIARGESEERAELQARLIVESEFGESLFDAPEKDPLDRHITKLEAAGVYLSEGQKARVKSLMRIKGFTALDAAQEIETSDMKKQFQEEHWGGKMPDSQYFVELEYMDLLTPQDKRILAGLKIAMPAAGWSAKKFYKQQYGNKPRRKAPPIPEPERVVPWEKYEEERQRYERLRQQFINEFNIDPDDYFPPDAA